MFSIGYLVHKWIASGCREFLSGRQSFDLTSVVFSLTLFVDS